MHRTSTKQTFHWIFREAHILDLVHLCSSPPETNGYHQSGAEGCCLAIVALIARSNTGRSNPNPKVTSAERRGRQLSFPVLFASVDDDNRVESFCSYCCAAACTGVVCLSDDISQWCSRGRGFVINDILTELFASQRMVGSEH